MLPATTGLFHVRDERIETQMKRQHTRATPGHAQVIHTLAWRTLQRVAQIGAVLVLLFTIVSLFARFHWRCEQLCHFPLQYGWLLSVAAAVFFIHRDRRFAMASVVGAAANFLFVVPIYLPSQQPLGSGPAWKLISYNVLASNERFADVAVWLRQEQADVVILLEVDERRRAAVEDLGDMYPHQHVIVRNDNFGLALLSRVPWKEVDTIELGPARLPSIVARFDAGGIQGTVIGTHPLPPATARSAMFRNKQLQALADFARQAERPVVLAGDLNVTSYSPQFRELSLRSALRDSRQGHGIHASWSPGVGFLAIPIDHCLVSREVAVVSRHVGPYLGSDHRPVVVELRTPDLPSR
jgi:endonuclease/exonuclease/phosphatase (EEP) superfamily protein YafD